MADNQKKKMMQTQTLHGKCLQWGNKNQNSFSQIQLLMCERENIEDFFVACASLILLVTRKCTDYRATSWWWEKKLSPEFLGFVILSFTRHSILCSNSRVAARTHTHTHIHTHTQMPTITANHKTEWKQSFCRKHMDDGKCRTYIAVECGHEMGNVYILPQHTICARIQSIGILTETDFFVLQFWRMNFRLTARHGMIRYSDSQTSDFLIICCVCSIYAPYTHRAACLQYVWWYDVEHFFIRYDYFLSMGTHFQCSKLNRWET